MAGGSVGTFVFLLSLLLSLFLSSGREGIRRGAGSIQKKKKEKKKSEGLVTKKKKRKKAPARPPSPSLGKTHHYQGGCHPS